MMLLKRLFIGFAGLVVLGLLAFFVLAYEPAIAPITPPPAASFPPDLVARGEALAGGGFARTAIPPRAGERSAAVTPCRRHSA